MLTGAVIPHAPILLLSGGERDDLPATRLRLGAALESLASMKTDLVVVVSPHGRTAGVYGEIEGSLASSGIEGMEVSAPTDPGLVGLLAEAWGVEVFRDPVDRGVVVPLLLGALPEAPVVAVALSDWTPANEGSGGGGDPRSALAQATRLAAVLPRVLGSRNALIVASAHLSAGSSRRAPMTEVAAAHDLDRRALSAIETDVGMLGSIPADGWGAAGACGAGPLSVLGALFAGTGASEVSFDAPVGVGYVVATVRGG